MEKREELLRLLSLAYARRELGVRKDVPVTVYGRLGRDYEFAPDSVLERDLSEFRKKGLV